MYRLKLSLHGTEVTELSLESGREYVFGRAAGCDVQLEEQPGISRQHFRVFEEDGQWRAQVVSKFGELIYAGQPTQTLPLEPGSVFKVAAYDFQFLERAGPAVANMNEDFEAEAIEPLSTLPVAVGQSMPISTGSSSASAASDLPVRLAEPPPAPFEGNDEATRVVASVAGIPYVRIVLASGEEELLKLEGRRWHAGREETCEILLNDRKASRRQFELTSSSQGYFVRDLGSSNGTLFNGMPLAPDELKAIRSGDVLQVGGLTLHFEIRDPSFEKKLMVVAPEVMSAVPAISQSPYEMINYPMPIGPGGAVRMDQGALEAYNPAWGAEDASAHDLANAEKLQKQKKMRMILIGAVVLLFAMAYLKGGDDDKKPQATAVMNDPFSKLTPANQRKVKESFVLAKNLYMQGKHELAAQQLKTLHEILPEGYENSLAISEELQAHARNQENLRFAQEEQKRAEENMRKVQENITQCAPVVRRTLNIDEARSCLGIAISLDPSNPQLSEALAQVERRIVENNQRLANQRDFADRAARGRSLYDKAVALEKSGDALGAIEAYRKHIASSFPDPNGLKAKSKSNMAALSKNINSQVAEALAAAEKAYGSQQYRDAINEIKRAKQYDPSNIQAAELNAKIRRDLNIKLRGMYEEAIISEGLGQVDQAKENWKKIIDMDHPEGEYYKRAKNKMRAYGGA